MHFLKAIIDWYRRPYAPPRKKTLFLFGLALALNFLDGVMTYAVIEAGICEEYNLVPSMLIGYGWWLFFLVKIGIGSAAIYWAHRRLTDSVLGWYAMIGICAVLGLIVAMHLVSAVFGVIVDIMY